MKIISEYKKDESLVCTIELENEVFVDVKCIGNICCFLERENGYLTYNSNGKSFDCIFNKNEVIAFVKEEYNRVKNNEKYKTNLDVLNNGTQEEKKIVLTSFMYWLNNFNVHSGLVDEWLQKKPYTNCEGKIIL